VLATSLSWSVGGTYDAIEVRRDGSLVATLPGGATAYPDAAIPAGSYAYEVRGVVAGVPSDPRTCSAAAFTLS